MRHMLVTTNTLGLAAGLLCLLTVLATATGHAAPKRGDTPHCQETCLADHQRQMEKLTRDLDGKLNRLEFQNCVEDAVKEYTRCIENCREPHPVK
jgi:hypothetical protein